MKRILVALVLLLPLGLLTALLQLQPSVPAPGELDARQITRIEQLIVDNQPPRLEAAGEQLLSLDAGELNLLAAYAFESLPRLQDWAGDFTLSENRGRVELSIPWQTPGPRLYVNVRAEVRQGEHGPELSALSFGRLPLPASLSRVLWEQGLNQWDRGTGRSLGLRELFHSIDHVAIAQGRLDILLRWEPQVLSSLRSQAQQLLIGTEDVQRIGLHTQTIGEVIAGLGPGRHVLPLNALLSPLFAAALERSENGADPAAEVRTLFQALALYLNELVLEDLEDELAATVPGGTRVRIVLEGRQDLARHLVTSAAITSSAGPGIADILSASKEAYDARYSSGFSFSDMTANAAGRALAERAQEPEGALSLLRRMAATGSSRDYMPEIAGNEALSELDFAERYEDRHSEDYQLRLKQIEAEIADLPLHAGERPGSGIH